MRINAIPQYNLNMNRNQRKDSQSKQVNFNGKIPQNLKHDIGNAAAIAGFLSIPFLFCYIAKKILSRQEDTHDHIFLNDGTYFIHTKEFY